VLQPPLGDQRHDVEVQPPQRRRDDDAERGGGHDAGLDLEPLGADADGDDRLAERDDDDQPVALGEVAGHELPPL
jgi:hypothetical protein